MTYVFCSSVFHDSIAHFDIMEFCILHLFFLPLYMESSMLNQFNDFQMLLNSGLICKYHEHSTFKLYCMILQRYIT